MRPHALLIPLALLGGCFPLFGDDGDDDDGPRPDEGPTGTLDDVWQRTVTDLQVIDTLSGGMKSRTVAGPTSITEPDSGATYEALLRVEDDALVTYAWQRGEPVYHRIAQPWAATDGSVFQLVDDEGARTFQLDDGHLTENVTRQTGPDEVVLAQATYGAVDTFPPEGWPSRELVAPERPQEEM